MGLRRARGTGASTSCGAPSEAIGWLLTLPAAVRLRRPLIAESSGGETERISPCAWRAFRPSCGRLSQGRANERPLRGLLGTGTPVVLVHGSLATGAEEWQAQRPLADE